MLLYFVSSFGGSVFRVETATSAKRTFFLTSLGLAGGLGVAFTTSLLTGLYGDKFPIIIPSCMLSLIGGVVSVFQAKRDNKANPNCVGGIQFAFPRSGSSMRDFDQITALVTAGLLALYPGIEGIWYRRIPRHEYRPISQAESDD
jgi:hypothetical protein